MHHSPKLHVFLKVFTENTLFCFSKTNLKEVVKRSPGNIHGKTPVLESLS